MKRLFGLPLTIVTFVILFTLSPETRAGDDIYGDQLAPNTNWVGDPGGANSPTFSMDANGNLLWGGRTYTWNPANDRYEALNAQGLLLWWLLDYNQPGHTDDHFLYGQENPDGSNQQVIAGGTMGQTP